MSRSQRLRHCHDCDRLKGDLCWNKCRNIGATYHLEGDLVVHLCRPCNRELPDERRLSLAVPVTPLVES